jgi:hypothetical protein
VSEFEEEKTMLKHENTLMMANLEDKISSLQNEL